MTTDTPRHRRTPAQGGTAGLEFVLVAPVLLVALLFVVGLGLMAQTRGQVEGAAAAAARAASLERDTALAADAGRSAAAAALGRQQVTCVDLAVRVDVSSYEPGGVVRAEVTCAADLSEVVLAGFPGQATFTASSVVPIEEYRAQ